MENVFVVVVYLDGIMLHLPNAPLFIDSYFQFMLFYWVFLANKKRLQVCEVALVLGNTNPMFYYFCWGTEKLHHILKLTQTFE